MARNFAAGSRQELDLRSLSGVAAVSQLRRSARFARCAAATRARSARRGAPFASRPAPVSHARKRGSWVVGLLQENHRPARLAALGGSALAARVLHEVADQDPARAKGRNGDAFWPGSTGCVLRGVRAEHAGSGNAGVTEPIL